MFKIKLGCGVKDQITGFAGMVIGRTNYITGCNTYLVQPRVDDKGMMVDSHWFDEDRLDVTTPAVSDRSTTAARPPGGDKPAPKR